MFTDEATISVRGGNGGRGCVSWRREKFEPRGGPDGGDGGRGGDVVIVADENTDTLSDFASRKKFEAPKGLFGRGQNKCGKDGGDLLLRVPPGTTITELFDEGDVGDVMADLRENGDRFVAASGGRGGYGNAHFKTATRQAPDFAELGEPGHQRHLKLELRLVADVGIIGYPSVGKSTLISVISAARPQIAPYPFTTLVPHLGVVTVGERSYVVCDVPGLIERASEGRGLGDKFLRHIERTGVLLHVLDVERALGMDNALDVDILQEDYLTIRKELSAYSERLSYKRELVLLNKIDLVPDRVDDVLRELRRRDIDVFLPISAAARVNVDELTARLLPIVLEERERRERIESDEPDALPVLRPHLAAERMGAYNIERGEDGVIRIKGKRIEQFTRMVDFSNTSAVDRFRDVIERIGLLRAIKRLRREGGENAPVSIGNVSVESFI